MLKTTQCLAMVMVTLAMVGCVYSSPYALAPKPGDYPLSFSERKRGESLVHLDLEGKLDTVRPLPIREVLLLPQYMRRENGKYTVRLAHPVLYRPGTPLAFVNQDPERDGKIQGVLAVCRGYLPENIPYGYMFYSQAYGTECALVELVPAQSSQETAAMLRAFSYVLSQPEFKVGPTRIVEELPEDEWLAYATSQVLRSKTVPITWGDDDPSMCVIWDYKVGVTIACDFTDDEKRMIQRFLQADRSEWNDTADRAKSTTTPTTPPGYRRRRGDMYGPE